MAESLGSRVGRIVSGSFNALVNAMENAVPETVLEEAIREVEAANDDVRAELGREIARKHLASTRLMEENQSHEDLNAKIELALEEEREDLAEIAAAKQLDIEAQIPVLERTLADCADREKELEGFVAALSAKRRQMWDELRQLEQAKASATSTGSAGDRGTAGGGVQARVDKATSTFERVLERASGVPGATGSVKSAAQLAELEDLARQNRVRERLAAAKARMKNE